jgi:hypothetical protein
VEIFIRDILIRQSQRVVGFAIFLVFATLFILLRTQQYLAVDGAVRCLSVYWLGRPMAGGNNHLLYFLNIYVWMKTLSLAGVNAADAFDFVRLSHLMNALAAAGSLWALWRLCCCSAKCKYTAFAVTCGYAFSNAFLLHATSTAEPMMGLFWSFASILMVTSGLAVSSQFRLVMGGVLLLLSMATYESMVLIGPAELLLIYCWDQRSGSHHNILALWFLLGCLLGGIAAYAPIYILSGTSGPLAMWRRFFEMGGGEQVYGGFSASKLLNLIIGFANSIIAILPIDYQGVRSLLSLHHNDRWLVLTSGTVLVLAGWLIWTLFRLVSVWPELKHRQRLILECCAIALVFDIFPLIYWDPLYDKLWLQPVAVVAIGSSVVLTAWGQRYQRRLVFLPEALLITVLTIRGLTGAVEARSSTPCLNASRHLAGILRSSDLLVAEWDPVSLLYSSFWGNGAKRFDVPATATGNGPDTVILLNEEISRITGAGGKTYFLGVLDMPEANWKPYLERRCHLPYRSLDGLRRCARPVANLTCNDGSEVLWRLSIDCYKP